MGDHPTGWSLFAGIMAVSTIASVPGRAPWCHVLLANGLWMNAIRCKAFSAEPRTEVRPPREDAIKRPRQPLTAAGTGAGSCHHHGRRASLESSRGGSGARPHDRSALAAHRDRRTNARALTAILDAWFATRTGGMVAASREDGRRVRRGRPLDDVPHDAQMRASGALVPIDDREWRLAHRVEPAAGRRSSEVPPHSRRRSASTPSRCCAPPASPAEIERLLQAGYRSSLTEDLGATLDPLASRA